MENRKNNKVAIAFIFILMVLAAVVENTKGIFIPSFKAEFGVSDNAMGTLLIVTSAANMILTFIGGTLCEKVGQKKVFIIGLITIIASLIFLSKFTNSYETLLFGLGLSAAGLALTAIASNTIIPIIVLSAQTIIMNLLHFCYGFGSSIGQGVSGALLSQGINWRSIYLYVGIIYIVMLIAFIFVKIPTVKKEHETQDVTLGQLLKNKLIWAYMLGLGLYCFAEQGTGNWFVNFMKDGYGFNEANAMKYVSTFFLIFAIGRLLGGFVVEKFGYFNVLIVSLFTGAALYFIGMAMGESGMAVISFSGLFFSITFPTTVLSISKVFKEKSAYITGVIITATNFMGMILNKAIGMLNDMIGAEKAYYIIPISLTISAIIMIYLYKNTKEYLVKERVMGNQAQLAE